MAITVASSNANGTAASPLSLTLSAVADDYCVACYASDAASGAASYGSPLVQIVSNTSTADGQSFYSGAGKATGSLSSISTTNAASTIVGTGAVFRGVDTTTALDVTFNSTNHSGSSSSAGTATASKSITTVTAGAMLVFMVGWDTTSTSNPTTTINDGGAGLTWTVLSANESGGFRKCALAYAIAAAAGTYTIIGNSTVSAGYGMCLLALRPSGGGGGGGDILLGQACL